ncbi:MAG: alpha/beta fold hydrolase [Gemmatimonadaceae bacterium]
MFILPFILAFLGTPALTQPATTLQPRHDCPTEDAPLRQECWGLGVPENRSVAAGRVINLRITRLTAKNPGRRAIFIFQGGPGQAATTLASFYARIYSAARETHDIVLIDQRGTGGSNALNCNFGGSSSQPQRYFADLFDRDVVRACRANLAKSADLRQYTTAEAVRDADAVRAAFGYDAIDVFGTSYGTRVALEFARRNPLKTRTVTLKGIFAPDVIAPVDFARDVERSVMLMVRDCRAQATCATAFPNLDHDLRNIAERLDSSALTVPLSSGQAIVLSRGVLGLTIRTMLQATSLRKDAPVLIYAAARGNFTPLADRILTLRHAGQSEIAVGMMLSVFCAEDVPYLAKRSANRNRGTILGSYWIDQLVGACRLWPQGTVSANWRRQFHVSTPTLLISGYLDPATPPTAASGVQRYLSRSLSIVAPGASHSFTGMEGCVDRIMGGFIIAGSLQSLDTGCVHNIVAPPFSTSLPRPAHE